MTAGYSSKSFDADIDTIVSSSISVYKATIKNLTVFTDIEIR